MTEINVDKENYDSSEKLLSSFICFFDSALLIISLFFFKSKNKIMNSLRLKAFILFTIDIAKLRIYILLYNRLFTISNELFFTLIYSCQFLLIISSLEQILNNIVIKNIEEQNGTLDPYKLFIFCFFAIFSYESLFTSPFNLLSYFHYSIIFKCLLRLNEYLNKTVIRIIGILNGTDFSFFSITFLANSPNAISLMAVVYYFLNLWWDLIQKGEFNLLIKLGISIFGLCTKIYSFFGFIFLLYILDYYMENQEHLFKKISDNEDENAIIYQK
jgi:hypothetical protein